MSPQGFLTVLILALATAAFAVGRWRPDAIAVLVLLALLLLRVVDVPAEFAGFGSPALLTVAAVFSLSPALERGGLAAAIGQRIFRWIASLDASRVRACRQSPIICLGRGKPVRCVWRFDSIGKDR